MQVRCPTCWSRHAFFVLRKHEAGGGSKIERAGTFSGGLAADQSQTLPHLVEKSSNVFNLQAIPRQQGVQDWVIEKVIERRLRCSNAHC